MEKILSISNVSKSYPGVKALQNVSFDVRKGEILALIGENGAGKSTLIKCLTGALKPDEGSFVFDGEEFSSITPSASQKLGIQAIYQEFNLAPSLTVAENIFMGMRLGNSAFMNRREMYRRAKGILGLFNTKISPAEEVRNLSVAHMQMVEIAKAIARNAKLLIMDEPTAPLTDDEVEALFSVIEKLKEKGVTIIYISHRLEELFQISDRVTVMRDGMLIGTYDTDSIDKEKLIYYMVGRKLSDNFPDRSTEKPGKELLRVENLCGNGVKNISFTLHEGEILGMAGLVGAGRTETARLIFGADVRDSGKIYVHGAAVQIRSPQDAIKHGIGLLTEDRKNQGLLLNTSISWNVTIPILKNMSHFTFIDQRKEMCAVEEQVKSLNIKTPSMKQKAGNLSGGNQQKVALAKWLAGKSKILIFDEPTRGIDVGAKQEIYQLISHLAETSHGIIIISSEMEEVLGMSDRLIVLAEGKITGRLDKHEFSQELVLKHASGEKVGGLSRW